MNQLKEQLFPSEFILDYMQKENGRTRLLAYTAFRFLSFAGAGDANLANRVKANLSCPFTPQAFTVIEDYLMEDYYFSPSLTQGTYEPLYLYAAISLINAAHTSELDFLESLILEYCPAAASLNYHDSSLQLSCLLQSGTDFYGALYLVLTKYEADLCALLPKFTAAYEESYHFTCEDFILFDFMDEYFEQQNCVYHDSFTELIDTLVAATLNYYNTDFETLLAGEAAHALAGTSSRFAGTKRLGSMIITSSADADMRHRMLAESFRYAAIYELRSNLFDFHLEDDKLITLTNWKENLRWHYVQYANVYDLALDSFHTGLIAKELLRSQFAENMRS